MRDAENTARTPFPDRGEPRRPPARTADPGVDDDEPGYVIHLPVHVQDLATASALAGRVADSLGFLPELDAGETTVSTADDQNNRHRVFCDLLLPDRSRCRQYHRHPGPCGEVPPVPAPRPVPRPSTGP